MWLENGCEEVTVGDILTDDFQMLNSNDNKYQ